MALLLGDVVPNFSAPSSQGEINLYAFKEASWLLFFSHPADFTPVCTTELGATAKLVQDFQKRNCKVLALSVDGTESHIDWVRDINETQQCEVSFPIVADPERHVADLYGMIHTNSPTTLAGKLTVRSVFLIDPENKLRMTLTYPASTGRNFKEIIRVLDSIQLADKHRVVTPANWQPGEDVIIPPSIKDEEASNIFPKGFTTVKPYLRFTPDPSVVASSDASSSAE
eukprot:CAMPEP_0184345322 /NCGR_PEP_ID=MMETSP1089-20130417/13748_1 /TAXON_ID=38269 ORGANISM="Gloeochaete wittrockiana, Strain SAG46.84" /NCGR_SAMPLE_ID=MMETSP1089 /ASSEMBLY_ACC=CAM_ASM_000445 /LENGTH=226 /DNA_ID=CAMNT_0026675575 /DNA_START=68 /DNA_END=748 /DNA_ORIENTATION=-